MRVEMLAKCYHIDSKMLSMERPMGTLTIRNLDDDVIARLKEQAKANHRSLEAQVREVLARAASGDLRIDFRALAERIAAMTPDVPQTDSTQLLREDRDR